METQKKQKRKDLRAAIILKTLPSVRCPLHATTGNGRYFATDAECKPMTPMTINPSDTIFTVVAGSLK